MKFVSSHPVTKQALETWASPATLCTAQYFFWNQGYEMQRNQLGLFQSLLYQILRNVPELILEVCPERLVHEEWDLETVQNTLQQIATTDKLSAKFCFFIDGLDEYDGAEEELIEMLRFLSTSNNIKICVSTRPRRLFQQFFHRSDRTITISDFTKDDMQLYVQRGLRKSEKFLLLERNTPECGKIVQTIVDLAQGVWLWVFLVSRDVIHAVNRDEGFATLRKIVHQFPADLEAYFERMIRAVRPEYREEMSRIFLITVDELQPLPLFAFSHLENLSTDADFAVNFPLRPVADEDIDHHYPEWTSWINNRCSDLLIIDEDEHPTFLSHSVDFLHRSVRDFLQDSYYSKLQENLGSKFCTTITLANMCLILLKSLTIGNFRDWKSIHQVISLTDEILYYVHEAEKQKEDHTASIVAIVDEVNRVNSQYAQKERNHWTHARDPAMGKGVDVYNEGDSCNILALTVQARLVKYVRAKLQDNPSSIQKRGRPLLDYALRPRRTTPIIMRYHSQREDPSVDVDMVRLLLEYGADPNQPVYLNGGKTVWELFLISCHENKFTNPSGLTKPTTGALPTSSTSYAGSVSASLIEAWYLACELLISHGAQSNCHLDLRSLDMTVHSVLELLFGIPKASRLKELMEEKAQGIQSTGSSCALM
jgi:hypothetical protein